MNPRIIKAHKYFQMSINTWSKILVIGRKVDYDHFIKEYATPADVRLKLYRHIRDARDLRGLRFGMCICLESFNWELYEDLEYFIVNARERKGEDNE